LHSSLEKTFLQIGYLLLAFKCFALTFLFLQRSKHKYQILYTFLFKSLPLLFLCGFFIFTFTTYYGCLKCYFDCLILVLAFCLRGVVAVTIYFWKTWTLLGYLERKYLKVVSREWNCFLLIWYCKKFKNTIAPIIIKGIHKVKLRLVAMV